MTKSLSLARETLVALTAEDLSAVNGAAALPTTPVKECATGTLEYSELICYTRGTTCAC